MNSDDYTTQEQHPSKKKFNFWRFIRLCSLKDFDEFKDEQSRTASVLNNRLTALEQKLDNNTEIILKSIFESSNNFNNKLDDFAQNTVFPINESLAAFIKQQEEFNIEIRRQLSEINASLEQLPNIVSKITEITNQQIQFSQDSTNSLIESINELKTTIVEQIKKNSSLNKNTQNKVENLCASIAYSQNQLNQQSENHSRIQTELMQNIRMLVMNSLSGQIELLEHLLPDSSKDN